MSVDIAVGPIQGSIVDPHDLLYGSVILKSQEQGSMLDVGYEGLSVWRYTW